MKTGLWEDKEGSLTLRAPAVGIFRPRLIAGSWVIGGELLGHLEILGRREEVRVPSLAGPHRIATVNAGAMEYGSALAVAEAVEVGEAAVPAESAVAADDLPEGAQAVRAPIDGMFFIAPSPEEAPFISMGADVSAGQIVGLVEVMKFFYEIRAEDMSGRVVKIDVDNGTPVEAGDPIVWLVP